MQIELIKSADHLEGTLYFEFRASTHPTNRQDPASVYLHLHAFDIIVEVLMAEIPEFAYFGPTTISNHRIEGLAKALDEFAKLVNKAETPGAIWRHIEETFIENLSDELADWRTAKREVSIMLRDLAKWLRGVAAQHGSVYIPGI